MKLLYFIILFITFIVIKCQTMDGAYLKYDYCIKGSTSCTGSLCGGTPSVCVADTYILLRTCTRSGLGVDQPKHDPNVFSQYLCNGESYQVNYTTLDACKADTTYPPNQVYTKLGALGYSNFCWGGKVSFDTNPFPQIDMSKGYYTKATIACPANTVSVISLIEDPVPSVCVDDVQTCSASSPPFIVSTKCYPPPACNPVCGTNGKCTATNTCTCSNGFTGPTCEIPPPPTCNPACATNGKCTATNTCTCSNGFTGTTCEVPPPITCNPACAANGDCTATNKCTCKNGYTGATCALPPVCSGIKANVATVCSRRGKCIATNRCKCNPGFYGVKCENVHQCYTLFSTNIKACSGNGKCIGTNKCLCNAGFSGVKCTVKAPTNVLEEEDEEEEDEEIF
jgi:hypothetical protein